MLFTTEMEWRTAALALLGLLSVVPVHLATFALALPPHLRLLLDAEFKFSFSYLFLCYAVFAGLIARYTPVVIFGMLGFVHDMSIDKMYYQRGYRRAYVSFTGTGKLARQFDGIEDFRKHFARVKQLKRADARLSNLRRNDFQKRYPISFYERHRWVVTALLSVIVFGYLYIGPWRAIFLVGILLIVFAGLISYGGVASPFRFKLQHSLWRDSDLAQHRTIDIDDILNLVTIVALASALSGYMRVGYLSREAAQVETFSHGHPLAIVAAVSVGAVAYDNATEEYYFLPWSGKL